jgi:hypothetical protein
LTKCLGQFVLKDWAAGGAPVRRRFVHATSVAKTGRLRIDYEICYDSFVETVRCRIDKVRVDPSRVGPVPSRQVGRRKLTQVAATVSIGRSFASRSRRRRIVSIGGPVDQSRRGRPVSVGESCELVDTDRYRLD